MESIAEIVAEDKPFNADPPLVVCGSQPPTVARKHSKSSRMAKHIARQQSLFPIKATKEEKAMALRMDIENYPAQDVGAMGHIARLLAQFGLPHSNPGDEVKEFTRENGDLSFRIRSLVNDGGIPWGVLPRLLLAYTSSQACLTKSRTIQLGTNLTSFLTDELGMTATGGENGSITRMKEQAYRLFTSNISILRKKTITGTAHPGTLRMLGLMNFAEGIEMWEPELGSNAYEMWHSTITLAERFYKETISAAIPIDFRIIRGIQQSPLAIDLYFWLTYRMKTLQHPTPVTFFGENSIFQQLGSGYQDNRNGRDNFRKETMKQLEKVHFYWPKLRVTKSSDGKSLKLFPSPTSVTSLT